MPKKKKTASTDTAAWLGAGAGEPQPPATESTRNWPTLGVRCPPDLVEDMRDLARQLSRSQGKRVRMSDLLTEALRDLLAKYKE